MWHIVRVVHYKVKKETVFNVICMRKSISCWWKFALTHLNDVDSFTWASCRLSTCTYESITPTMQLFIYLLDRGQKGQKLIHSSLCPLFLVQGMAPFRPEINVSWMMHQNTLSVMSRHICRQRCLNVKDEDSPMRFLPNQIRCWNHGT